MWINNRLWIALRRMMLAALVASVVPLAAVRASDTDATPIKAFNERVKRYVEIHKKVEAVVDPVDQASNATILVLQKERFAKAVRAARPHAVPGEIFISSVRPVFIRILKQELSGPGGAKARAMILGEGNPKSEGSEVVPELKVNASYPTKAPVSTVPPSVLLALPQLPEELEYRFIGRDLILRDTKANVIVDFIKNAVSRP